MYEYKIIEENLKTKYFGRVFLQFDNLESTNIKGRNISQNSPNGILILSEDDLEGNLYINDDKKFFDKKILMSIILKENNKTKKIDNIESIINILTSTSIMNAVEKYFNNIAYKWDRIITGENIEVEIDNFRSQKNIDNSVIVGIKIHYKNNDIVREKIVAEVLNNFEENYVEFLEGKLIEILNKCNEKLIDKNIEVRKKNRKTIKEFKNININESGNLMGTYKDERIEIKWNDYIINW